MKQIKIIILKPTEKIAKETAEELKLLLEDDWIIINQDRTQSAIVYVLIKVPDEVLRQIQSKQALANILK